ncbi:MAG: VWA domain-containing protein [Deltaproteobacteria bacterium]|nr:VWA domain-containing protein [Deltaproteobacteria bacterium]
MAAFKNIHPPPDSAVLLPEEVENYIVKIVQRTRTHPQITRGAGSRSTLAIQAITEGYRLLSGTLRRHEIEKAALIALPGRIQVQASSKKSAFNITLEITRDILFGITSFEYGDPFKDQNKQPGQQNTDTFIEELVQHKEQQHTGNTRLKNLHAEYVRRHQSGEPVDPEKLDYSQLQDKLHELQKQGIVQLDDVGDGFTLQGIVLLNLLNMNITRELNKSDKTAKIDSARDKTLIRKFLKGDPYSHVSIRHTVRQLVRRGKTIKDVCLNDIRTFERTVLDKRDIVICIDISDSMREDAKLHYAKIAAAGIARSAIKNRERVGLITFSNTADILCPLTLKINRIFDSLMNIRTRRYTNIGDGIKKARELLLKDKPSNRKLLIIISDGLPNITGDKTASLPSTIADPSTMDNFCVGIGARDSTEVTQNHKKSTGLELMFRNIAGIDYAVHEAKKSWKRNIEVSFAYIGEKSEDPGEIFAKKIARIGGGTYMNIKRITELPAKTLEILQ